MRERDHSCRHGGGGAAARSTHDAVGVPRVAGGSERLGLGGGRQAELGRVRLAEDHEARAPEPSDELAVGRRDPASVVEEARAAVVGRVRERGAEVLERERHAVERAVADGAGRDLGPGAVVEANHDRVQQRIDAVHGGDGLLEQLRRRAGARADEARLRGGVERCEIHGASSFRPAVSQGRWPLRGKWAAPLDRLIPFM